LNTKKTLLIVEDNVNDAHLLEDRLRKSGVDLRIEIVWNGFDAIKYLATRSSSDAEKPLDLPSAIFLDLKLPDMSGYEVLRWIACQPQLRRVLIVVHSGFESTKEIEGLYAAGANTFLRKSNDESEVNNLIDAFRSHF
jgi:two-component system response regulator